MPEWAWRALWDLSDAGDFDGIIALLQTLITNDSITKAEAADFFDRLVADIEEKAPELDPDSKAYLEAYTSEKDLADRISYLLRQGIIPDEATAGAFYNRVLGITADRKELDALEANRFAPPEALEAAQKRYEAAQAALNQEAGMFIRAGTARGEAATAKEEARQRAERIAGINYVNKLNAGVQADYEEELAKAEEAQLKARFDAPYIEANKREYLPPLRAVLATAVRAGAMTQEQADATFADETWRIEQGETLSGLPNFQQVKTQVQNEEERRLIGLEQINAERARAEQEALNAPRIEAAKKEYLPYLRKALANAVRAGVMTQEQADSQFNSESSLIDRGFSLRDLPNYNQVLVERENEETRRLVNLQQINLAPRIKEANRQLALSELFGRSEKAGLERLLKERQWQAGQPELLPEPSYASVYEPFLAGIGAPNFRRFIESRLGRIAEGAETARAKWWEGRNAPPEPRPFGEVIGETYADVVARLQKESGRLGNLLLGQGIAPTMGGAPTAEGTAFGWQQRQNEMNARLAELYGMGESGFQDYALRQMGAPAKEEDPFKAAMEAYPFLEQFMALSPGERGYQKQRFAPRITWRGF